jgi:hypothetical protein
LAAENETEIASMPKSSIDSPQILWEETLKFHALKIKRSQILKILKIADFNIPMINAHVTYNVNELVSGQICRFSEFIFVMPLG